MTLQAAIGPKSASTTPPPPAHGGKSNSSSNFSAAIRSSPKLRMMTWRRSHGSKRGALISPFTVNATTEQLKKLFTRAKAWDIRFPREPIWKKHWLKVPEERVRELMSDEKERLEAAMRDDLAPFFAFAEATGFRFNECLLKWSEVDWDVSQIRKKGKGGKLVVTTIDDTIRGILWPLRGHHPEFVFTYVAQMTSKSRGLIKGERYPLNYNGAQKAWRCLRAAAGVEGFRFHDFRHNFGTKFLRLTGNLKLTQRAMNHANLKTTARYAHVLDSEVAEALARYRESLNKSPTDSRKRA
jgi:integrase